MRRLRVALIGGWLLLLLGSQLWIAGHSEPHAPERAARLDPWRQLDLPAMRDDGPVPGRRTHVALREFHPQAAQDATALPVIMIHGSPGSASNFEPLGHVLAEHGRDAYALDLPGFGESDAWVPSYSIRAHAHAVLAAMDALGIERAHLVAWSMGGGVVLHAADLAPERVASLCLIASIGVQEAEGSGSYWFEHVKYALNWLLVVALPELVPHFGYFGPRQPRHAYARNFWDSDQRPLRSILQRMTRPVLILHGRNDFLVPAWTAQVSHELLPRSRLVMLEASHFLPFGPPHGQLAETSDELLPFLAACDGPEPAGVSFESVDRTLPHDGGLEPFLLQRLLPWWLLLPVIVAAWLTASEATVLACGVLVGTLQLEFGFALVACGLALCMHDFSRGKARPSVRRWLAGLGWTLALFIAGMVLGGGLVTRLASVVGGLVAVVLAVALLCAPLLLAQRYMPGRTLLLGRGKRLALTSSSPPR